MLLYKLIVFEFQYILLYFSIVLVAKSKYFMYFIKTVFIYKFLKCYCISVDHRLVIGKKL